MNIKKYLISAGLIATILGGTASLVLAEDTTPKTANSNQHPKPMVIQVGPSGKVLLRGIVKTVGTTSLTVTSWGGDWTVNVSSTTNVMPESDLSKFKVGDFVGVHGSINQNAAWTIDAKLIRDWTAKKLEMENKAIIRKERKNNLEEIKEVMRSENPKNWEGVASNVNIAAKTFTLTVGSTAYTVTLVTDAKIVNRTYLTISFADIQNGHKVRVWGPVTDNNISAYVVRDISIPIGE